jgi:hypothetical protein
MPKKPKHVTALTVSSLVEIYRAERMPQRFSTQVASRSNQISVLHGVGCR